MNEPNQVPDNQVSPVKGNQTHQNPRLSTFSAEVCHGLFSLHSLPSE